MIEHKNAWLRAIDEALVDAHLGFASVSDDYDTAKRKLDSLIDWHVAVATDPDVNGGWKLVPVEPTQEMIEQGSSTINDSGGSARWSETREAWAAMLAAAPTPPVDENTSQERVRSEPDLWVWQYSNGSFSSATFKDRRACELNTLPNVPGHPVALYLRPPPLRMPEPMPQSAIFDLARANLTRIQRNDWTAEDGDVIEFARAIEAEVLRRVREANK